MNNPFQVELRQRLDEVVANGFDRLEKLDDEKRETAVQLLGILLEQACKCQHMGNISAARRAIKRIPSAFFEEVLISIVENHIDTDDEWEYRRLLELLDEIDSIHMHELLVIGKNSKIEDIREAAADFESR